MANNGKKKHGRKGYDVAKLFHIVEESAALDAAAFHEPRGNGKLGKDIPAFNLVPGCSCSMEARRTCFIDGCYAVKNACCHGYDVNTNNCLRAWTENLILIRYHLNKFIRIMDAWLSEHKPVLFRIHSAGDFDNVEYARAWKKLARKHPETRFLAFTKQFDIVRRVRFYQVPNFELVLSGWTGVIVPDDLRKHYRVAWCDDGTETRIPADAYHCPGDCTTCRACWFLSINGMDTYFTKH